MFLGAWHCDQKSFLLIFMEIIEKSCRFFLGFILFLRVIFFLFEYFLFVVVSKDCYCWTFFCSESCYHVFEFYWHRIIFVILALARSQLLSYVQSFQSVNTGEYGIWPVFRVGPTADEKLIIGFPCSLCPV